MNKKEQSANISAQAESLVEYAKKRDEAIQQLFAQMLPFVISGSLSGMSLSKEDEEVFEAIGQHSAIQTKLKQAINHPASDLQPEVLTLMKALVTK